jgi:hypothetical protein
MTSLVDERAILSVWMLLAALAGSSACSNDASSVDDATPSAPKTEPNPLTSPVVEPAVVDPSMAAREREMPLSACDQPLDAHGIAFVDLFFPVSDYCPRRRMGPTPAATTQLQMSRDDAGGTCMQGRITDGWAQLIVGFDGSNRNGSMPLPPESKPLDADSAGIDGVQFTLDTPPVNGLTLETAYVVGEHCFPGNCELHGDFYIMDSDGVAHRFASSGTYSFRFSDFQQAPWGDPGSHLDETHLAGMFFRLPSGDFDFCLSDFHFLDVNGARVL